MEKCRKLGENLRIMDQFQLEVSDSYYRYQDEVILQSIADPKEVYHTAQDPDLPRVIDPVSWRRLKKRENRPYSDHL